VNVSPEIAISERVELPNTQPTYSPTNLAEQPLAGLAIAGAVWIVSVVLLAVVPQFVAIPYIAMHYRDVPATAETLLADKTVVLLMIVGVLPAHIITLFMVWAVATRLGRRSIIQTLGLTWNGKFTLARSIGLAILLYLAAFVLTLAFGGQGTALDKLVESSRAAALTIAFLAVVTAPIVEESIYRGILYPAIDRVSNSTVAVILVTILFAGPHVPQYWPNIAIISSITLLSVALTILRARTGRLLPCIIVHLVFNGIQSAIIVAEPYLKPILENMRHGRPSGSLIRLLISLH